MLTRTFSLHTPTSAPDVLSYLADLRNHASWRHDVISCEVESGQPGMDGTIYRQHVQHVHQGPATAWREILAHVDPTGFVEFDTQGDGPVRASGTTRITSSDTCGSTVETTITIAFKGFGNLLRPVVAKELDRRMTTYPEALKHQLDALSPLPA